MRFLTYYVVSSQMKEADVCCTLHNQLFLDEDGKIYLVPRYFETDGYTIPPLFAVIAGCKKQYDMRPAVGHDLECKYHQAIVVKLDERQLKKLGLLHYKEIKIRNNSYIIPVCEDIPIKCLEVVDTTFNETNSRFKRMMKATGQLKPWRVNMMRFAVNFNIGWLFTGKHKINLETIYKDLL